VTTLTGKTAMVTGAGRGIGLAIATKLARHGAAVVVNDLDEASVEATVSAIRESGGRAQGCPGTVTDPGFAQRFIDSAMSSFGGIDIVVNNAGFNWDSAIQRMTDEQWQTMLDVHLTAPFRILRAVQPVVAAAAAAERARGDEVFRKIVNISSLSGVCGIAGQASYSSAKAGVVGLTKTLAKEWGRHAVNVNAVAFGLIRTRLTDSPSRISLSIDGRDIVAGGAPGAIDRLESSIPLRRAGTPEEAAGAVYLLCSPESDYITGQVVECSGGWSF
jgi:3-oxoacyl-[acyl-carrier protein] reductase